MLKNIKLKNSTVALIGVIIIFTGVFIGLYEYFIERKNKVYSEMNIQLFESEYPENIENNNEPIIEQPNNNIEQPEENKNQTQNNEYSFLGVLEIPKINLKRGFLDINSKYNNVDYNITIINGSTYPDEVNNNLILAANS